MALHFLSALFAAAAGAVACQQDGPTTVRPLVEVRARLDTTLTPVADTYVRQDQPNTPQGGALFLQVSPPTSRGRALLRFDTVAIRQYVGGGTLESARVELTINLTDNNWGPSGRTINLHRLTQSWTEAGATWYCADDAVPDNGTHDCSGPTAWQMGSATSPPWEATPTASAVITNGQTGVVSFSVTADVAATLAGTQTHYGWIVKKAPEDSTGAVRFESREGVVPPRLVVAVQDTSRPPVPPSLTFPDDSTRVVADPSDSVRVLYRTMAAVVFDSAASGTTIRSFLSRYQASIVGGMPYSGGYVIQFPDPGTSWEAVQAKLAEMRSEPGVRHLLPVSRRDYSPRLYGRYPSDAPTLSRSSWFVAGSPLRWAHWAVRAPLAWGCETGTYSEYRVTVGLLEWMFEEFRPDVPGAVVTAGEAGTPITQADRDGFERHGNVVASVVGAVGDNSVGVAGMIWASNLRLYSLGDRARGIPRLTNAAFVEQLLPLIEADSPKVLSVSISFGGPPSDSIEQSYLVEQLKRFLDRSPSTLIIAAAGNDGLTETPGQFLARVESSLGLTGALLRVWMDPRYSDRILLVSGSERFESGFRRWIGTGQSSTVILGATGLAAPAESVVATGLDRLGEEWVYASGTSVAAPLAAGAAALLFALDSLLTPSQVKQYLLAGASEPRLSPQTGLLTPPAPVDGLEGLYQLDAYGSLALLSRERVGTPICGYQVRVADSASIVLEPSTGARSPMPVPGANYISSLSVAQGGRLIAAFDERLDGGTPRTIVVNQLGQAVGSPLTNKRRRFLERDTVDAELSPDRPYPLFTIRPGDGSAPRTVDPVGAAAALTPDFQFGYGDIGPAADYAAVVTVGGVGDVLCAEGADLKRWWLGPVGATGALLGEERYSRCRFTAIAELDANSIGWSHDGRRVVFVTFKSDINGAFETEVTSAPTDGAGVSPVIQGLFVQTPRFSADDSLLTTGQSTPAGACQVQLRVPSSPATTIGSPSPGRDAIDCLPAATPVVPNTPPVYATVIGSTAFSGGLAPRGSAFNFTAVARDLRRWARPRQVARVQVN
jgi:hypothetical protein